MSAIPEKLTSSTRPLAPDLVAVIRQLQPGRRIQITQTVRVGQRVWTTTVPGTFREVNYLATGISTDRLPEDDIIVPSVHFLKDNGELSCVTLDENSKIEIIG